MNTKAQEFMSHVMKHLQSYTVGDEGDLAYNYIVKMTDFEWDDISATIAVNRLRDTNISKFKLPVYSDMERLALTEFIWVNDICGLHNSYWSRMWWMVKGGKLIKMFPPNSMLAEVERGERKADHRAYRRY